MKRIFSLALTFALLFALAAPALAADYDATSGQCGDNMTWKFEGDTLTITGTGRMWDFENVFSSDTPNDTPWLWKEPKTVNISEGVTYIGSYAFQRCTAETVNFPSTLTEIGKDAFTKAGIKSARLPEGLQVIGDSAFFYSLSLQDINLPNSLTHIGEWAFSSTAISSVTVPSGITVLEYGVFADCFNLRSVTLPEGLAAIDDCAFEWCKKLTSLTIPDSVQYIGSAFGGCGLTSLTIPDGVVAIEDGTFWGDETQLKTVTIPGSVTHIGDSAFEDCDKLTDVYYGGSREQWSAITIEDGNGQLGKATIHYSDAYVPTPVAGFSDVLSADYFAPAVQWAVNHDPQITNGIGDGKFGSSSTVTRSQAVTFLWRAANEPEPSSMSSAFSDVSDAGAWYYKAVLWAAEKGITNGNGVNSFGVGDSLTYEQMLTFMARAAGADTSGDWSAKAQAWARSNGLTDGISYSASGGCPRSDTVYFLWREMAK